MRIRPSVSKVSLALLMLAAPGSFGHADTDRSAAIRQVTRGATVAERSAAAFDQIATVESGRSKVDQIDPSLVLETVPESDHLGEGDSAAPAAGCILSPEQQAIVTSLEAQGKLPAGDCEMVAWFAQPGEKSEGEDRAALAASVAANAPELLGRESEADLQARLEAEQREAATAAAVISTTIFTPAPPTPPGK